MLKNPASNPYLYNEHKLEPFREKVKNVPFQGNTLNVLVVGDSIAEGWQVSTQYTDKMLNLGFVGMLNTMFAKRFTNVGNGIIPAKWPANDTSWSPWNIVSGWNATAPSIWSSLMPYTDAYVSNNSADSLTFRFTGTGIQVLFINDAHNGGKINVSIDGGASTQVLTYNASGWGLTTGLSATINASGYGNHTATFTINSGNGNYVGILGVNVIDNGSYGVRVHRLAQGSMTASYGQSTIPTILSMKPDLVLIEFLSNDYFNQVSLSSFQQNIEKLITATEQAGAVPLLTSIGIRASSGTIPQSNYVNVLKTIALTRDVAYYDNWTKWGGTNTTIAQTNGWYDGTHPYPSGYLDIATDLAQILTGDTSLGYDLNGLPMSGIPANNLYVASGTHFRNQSPTGGGTAGWISTTAGYANNLAWAASTAYYKGQMVNNGGNVYSCNANGTSAASSGPNGTGSRITDNTTSWAYIGPLAVFKTLANIST